MAVSMLAGFAIPLLLFLYFRRKYRCEIPPFFVGCGVMFVFAFILEQIVHTIVLSQPVGTVIQGSVWLYALYGGAMAGIFEETGRYLAFRTVLKKYCNDDHTALMYGAGHGGFEVFFLLVMSMASNLVMAALLNSGNAAMVTATLTGDALEQMEEVFRALAETPSWMFLIGILERLLAVALQLSLSVIVWFAAKETKNTGLLFAAIFLHMLVDGCTVVLSQNGMHAMLIEGILLIFVIAYVLIARFLWKREHQIEYDAAP